MFKTSSKNAVYLVFSPWIMYRDFGVGNVYLMNMRFSDSFASFFSISLGLRTRSSIELTQLGCTVIFFSLWRIFGRNNESRLWVHFSSSYNYISWSQKSFQHYMTSVVKKISLNNPKNKERTDMNRIVSTEHAKKWKNRGSIILSPKLPQTLWSTPNLLFFWLQNSFFSSKSSGAWM